MSFFAISRYRSAHILRKDCTEITGDRPRHNAYQIFSFKRIF